MSRAGDLVRGARSPVVVDAALAALVMVLGLVEVGTGQVPGPGWAAVAVSVGFGAAVLDRRRRPWVSLIAVYGLMLVGSWLGVSMYDYIASVLAAVLAMGTVAAQAALVPSLAAAAFAYVTLVYSALEGVGGLLWGAFVLLATWVAGRILGNRRRLIDQLQATTAELERSRELHARTAVLAERARLARDLHDVVAHSVSVMVVQAGAAQRMADRDPNRTALALEAVQETGRGALTDLRRLLGVLRSEGGDAAQESQSQLTDLDPLVGSIRSTGLAVVLQRTGIVRELEPSLELAAYRIVQEALTNTVKHAHATQVSVRLGYSAEELVIEVVDNGKGGESPIAGSGRGLTGMRERTQLYGGSLKAGHCDQGFAVHATLQMTGPSGTHLDHGAVSPRTAGRRL